MSVIESKLEVKEQRSLPIHPKPLEVKSPYLSWKKWWYIIKLAQTSSRVRNPNLFLAYRDFWVWAFQVKKEIVQLFSAWVWESSEGCIEPSQSYFINRSYGIWPIMTLYSLLVFHFSHLYVDLFPARKLWTFYIYTIVFSK